ncbi:unnamed protein product, partial [Closterium sp. NIES-65]
DGGIRGGYRSIRPTERVSGVPALGGAADGAEGEDRGVSRVPALGGAADGKGGVGWGCVGVGWCGVVWGCMGMTVCKLIRPSVPPSVFQECRLWVEQQMVQKTNNPLEEVEGYENIAVVVPHRVVDPSSLQAVHAMEQAADSSIRSDCE